MKYISSITPIPIITPTPTSNPGGSSLIVGDWNWYDGNVNRFNSNGTGNTIQGGSYTSTWVYNGNNKFTITWQPGNYIDNVTISPDGNTLSGTNQSGGTITATKKS